MASAGPPPGPYTQSYFLDDSNQVRPSLPHIPVPPPPPAVTPPLPPPGPPAQEPASVTPPVPGNTALFDSDPWRDAKRLEPTVSWLDFQHFKNRYSEKDGLSIIEVLRGHPNIHQEVIWETRGRAGKRWDQGLPPLDGDQTWMQRIRVQSPWLICLLSRLSGHGDRWPLLVPRVFYLPFRVFYYYLPQMKECLRILESNWGSVECDGNENEAGAEPNYLDEYHQGLTGADFGSSAAYEEGHMEPSVAVAGPVANCRTALHHVRCYVDFVEKHIVPRFDLAAGTAKRKVRFQDLWMSFKEGELIYLSPDPGPAQGVIHVGRSDQAKMSQRVWRLHGMGLETVQEDRPDDTYTTRRRVFNLFAYYVDYDGVSFLPIRHEFAIKDYEGEKDMTALPIYPMRFVKDADNIKAKLLEQGEWFQQVIKQKHLYHDGWTLTHGPAGLHPMPESTVVEHIQGDVIIDFIEGYKSEKLEPGPTSWTKGAHRFDDSNWPVGEDLLPIRQWGKASEKGERGLIVTYKELSQRGEWYGQMLANRVTKDRKILRAFNEEQKVTEFEDDDVLLLPCRVVGYSLRERKFVMLNIASLRMLPPAKNVFKDLKIDPEHKRMVRSLVKSHLQKQSAQKERPKASLNQDLIHGKGSGLVILLHGVPGVGKTATAEAVAQANRKPLFVITCGDLGYTAREVEAALSDIFRLAHHWGCILLLDEADIFLSRREMADLQRNALVSVFLRVLEYYSGILFLTTNRVGTLDEAFKSRIHVSLYYPPLCLEQTMAIFDVNIRRLEQIEMDRQNLQDDSSPDASKMAPVILDHDSILHYAEWHYYAHADTPEQRWNGRQIRNAFQIAHSLAHFDMQSSGDGWADEDEDDEESASAINRADGGSAKPTGPAQLSSAHFVKVANAIEKFEDYLYHATAGTDTDRARLSRTRADDYDPYRQPETPVYRPPRYQPRREYVPQGSRGPPRRGPPPQRPQYHPPRESQTPDRRPPTGRPVALLGSQRGRLAPRSAPYKKSPSPTPQRCPELPQSQASGKVAEHGLDGRWERDDNFADDIGPDGGYDNYENENRPYYEEEGAGNYADGGHEAYGQRAEYRYHPKSQGQ